MMKRLDDVMAQVQQMTGRARGPGPGRVGADGRPVRAQLRRAGHPLLPQHPPHLPELLQELRLHLHRRRRLEELQGRRGGQEPGGPHRRGAQEVRPAVQRLRLPRRVHPLRRHRYARRRRGSAARRSSGSTTRPSSSSASWCSRRRTCSPGSSTTRRPTASSASCSSRASRRSSCRSGSSRPNKKGQTYVLPQKLLVLFGRHRSAGSGACKNY